MQPDLEERKKKSKYCGITILYASHVLKISTFEFGNTLTRKSVETTFGVYFSNLGGCSIYTKGEFF